MPQITPFITPTFPSFVPKSVVMAIVGNDFPPAFEDDSH
jgi:hypothetical protein